VTEKKFIELINKEVDGLLNEKEKDQLHQYLNKDLKIKNIYQETIKTSELLKQVTDIDPSPNLKKGILNAIDTTRYTSKQKTNIVRSSISDWFTNLNPRLGYAFAAGLIIGLITFSVFLSNMVQEHPLDNINFYGTIGITENANIRELDQVPVEFPGLSGTIKFNKFEKIVWFEVNITNTDRFEIAFDYDQTEILFDSFKPLNQSDVLIQNKASTLNIVNTGDCNFLVMFTQKSTEKARVDLKLIKASEELFNYKFQSSSDIK